jgi:hypothetical protein
MVKLVKLVDEELNEIILTMMNKFRKMNLTMIIIY